MIIQLTDAGVALLTSTGQPFVISEYKLGSGVNYTPELDQTDIQGTLVYSSNMAAPEMVSGNLTRYSAIQDRSTGNYQFGEMGMFVGTTMVAIGVADALITKTKTTTGLDGNFLRIDAYLSMVGVNYSMWSNFGDSSNDFAAPSIQNVDQLLPTNQSVPNLYIVGAVSANQEAFMAYSDRNGLWMFDAYKYSSTIGHTYTVVAANSVSVTIADATLAPDLTPIIFGDRIIEFITGQDYSICRNVQTVTANQSANTVVLGFGTPLAIVPAVGDKFIVFNRDPLSTNTVEVPIATTTSLGIIQVGAGLGITVPGVLSVDRTTIPGGIVYSIAGKDEDGNPVTYQGDVTLTWRDVDAIHTVNGQSPDNTGNVVINTAYVLPTASSTVKGGVRVQANSGLQVDPTTGDLSLASAGTTPVTTVNGRNGPTVVVAGLVDPTPLASATDLNTLVHGQIYYAIDDATAGSLLNTPTFTSGITAGTLEVIAFYQLSGTGDVIQRWTQASGMAWRKLNGTTWSTWVDPTTAGLPIATTLSVGVISVGGGLNVTTGGQLSTKIQSINGHDGTDGAFVILTAEDVSAVPISAVDAQGGVAGLDKDPDPAPANPDLSNYVYGRTSLARLPFDTLFYRGDWDANANVYTYTDSSTLVHTVTLDNGGQMTDTWNDGVDSHTVTASASGWVMKVTTAGTTTLDGTSDWSVGDLAVALGDLWVKLALADDGPPQPVPSPVAALSGDRTLALADANTYFHGTNASPANVTVPTNATVAFPIGTEVHIRQATAVGITIVATSGVTINAPYQGTLTLAGQGSTVTLKKVDTDEWDLFGVTAAA
jgi:hypothetical protein